MDVDLIRPRRDT